MLLPIASSNLAWDRTAEFLKKLTAHRQFAASVTSPLCCLWIMLWQNGRRKRARCARQSSGADPYRDRTIREVRNARALLFAGNLTFPVGKLAPLGRY